MRPRDSIFLPRDRNIGKASITSLICGKASTSVRSYLRLCPTLKYCRCVEAAEEEDSHEALELDDELYPQLPENIGELRLRRRKGIVRQFMAATRRMCHAQHIPPIHC